MITQPTHTRTEYEQLVARHAHVLQQLANLDAAEDAQRQHVEATRPRLLAAQAAVKAAQQELEAAEREAGTGDQLGIGATIRRSRLEDEAAQLEQVMSESPWAPRT